MWWHRAQDGNMPCCCHKFIHWFSQLEKQNLIKKLADVCNRKETKIKECRRKKSKKNKVERREPKGLIWSVNLLQHVQYLWVWVCVFFCAVIHYTSVWLVITTLFQLLFNLTINYFLHKVYSTSHMRLKQKNNDKWFVRVTGNVTALFKLYSNQFFNFSCPTALFISISPTTTKLYTVNRISTARLLSLYKLTTHSLTPLVWSIQHGHGSLRLQ